MDVAQARVDGEGRLLAVAQQGDALYAVDRWSVVPAKAPGTFEAFEGSAIVCRRRPHGGDTMAKVSIPNRMQLGRIADPDQIGCLGAGCGAERRFQ